MHPLLERQEQLDVLYRGLEHARAGAGKLVLVAGEAGLGKSSLVERFASDHGEGVHVLWGACDGLATPRALAPVYEIALHAAGPDGRSAFGDESRDGLFRFLLDYISRPERTCIVMLEDLHWADEATLDFLRFIGRRIQRTFALFIATYRDDEFYVNHPVRSVLGEFTGHHVIRMRLSPLSQNAVGLLAKDSGRDPAVLHQITSGNPFFVREVLGNPDARVPETVRDAVLARLVRSPPAVRELVELVSMSPSRTETWLIESVLGPDQEAIDEAGARGLLVAQGESMGFRHELARLAVHSALSTERVRVMHRRVLRVLVDHGADLPRLVHHALLAHDAEAILDYAPRAAREAARLGAHREAAAHLQAALRYRASLTVEVQAELLEEHARESSLANQTREAIGSANAANVCWRQVGNIEAQSRTLSFLSQEYRTVGDKARADEWCARCDSHARGGAAEARALRWRTAHDRCWR